MDLLGPIKDAAVNGTVLTYSAVYTDVVCAPARSRPLPSGRLVIVKPSRDSRTCSGDFALALIADIHGRLQQVDLTLSNP